MKLASDKIGIWSSALCMVHCLAVPFALLVSKDLDLHHNPYWNWLQIVFIGISFWAVLHSTKHTASKQLKIMFWLSFAGLSASIIWHHSLIGEILNYGCASLLILLHGVNLYRERNVQREIALA